MGSVFRLLFFAVALPGTALLYSCGNQGSKSDFATFKLPEQGQVYALGEEVKVELDLPGKEKVSRVQYLLDGKKVGRKTDAGTFSLSTKALSLGYKLITAIVDKDSGKDTLTVNIVLKSPLKPAALSYKVLNVFPHDTSAYTQGLEFHKGRFLESAGEYGSSTLRWVDPVSGKVLQKIALDPQYFAEGSTLTGDQIVLLTWKENGGFVYDAHTLKQTGSFPYQNSREGWGLTFDGRQLIKSDGTNKLWFLNKDTYAEESAVEVYDNNGQVDQLNELEYIDGKVYANIYQTDRIAVINPKNGIVEQYIDLKGILPAKDRFPNTDVLNGIAWDAAGKRLFVTGKKFSKLFQISVVPAAQ